MKNQHKLYTAIASLSEIEAKQIRKMLKSPYFTRRIDLGVLFENLIGFYIKKHTFPKPEDIYRQIYPDKSWDYQRLRNAMSDLLRLIEECWMINFRKADSIKSELMLSKIYRRRNLEKCYLHTIKKTSTLLECQPVRNAYYYEALLNFQMEQNKFRSTTKRTEDLYLQEISDTHDVLYLIQKLQSICAQLSHQLVRDTTYDFGLLSKLLAEINNEKYLKIPAIAIYYYCFRFLTEPDTPNHFQVFKGLLNEYRHHFAKDDLEAPYRLALNHCIRKTNEGVISYIRDSWELYKEGLSEGILLENNYIPRFTFSNAIGIALRLGEFDWITSFIKDYAHQLEETFREQTITFNLAKLEFAQSNYEKALLHLHDSEFKDLMNNMLSKILLVKIYFELNEFESLNSQLDSFQQFIRRREVSDYHKTNILNIIRYVRKIIALPSYEKLERTKLRKQITAEAILSERLWLLEKI